MKRGIAAFIIVAIISLTLWLRSGGEGESASFRTAKVEKGTLRVVVSATGVLQPEDTIDVGAQIAGKINEFGISPEGKQMDFGSRVEEGAVLAKIDPSLFASDVAVAEAQLKRAKAELLSAEAKLRQAEREWARAQKIGTTGGVLSPSAYDAYLATFESSRAGVELSKAGVQQAEAALKKAEQNLDYCTIRSPVSGVIIDRKVNVGQTVVSSLNAPSLFLIAKDLTKMKLLVAVNEADIGSVHPGQKVTFNVDAFPDRRFSGEVRKVRLNASMNQNVVTYTVEAVVDNKDQVLLPYLTANVEFEVSVNEGRLLVPNQALRFRPPGMEIPEGGSGPGKGTIWKRAGESLAPTTVRVLGTDGIKSEIEGEGIQDGTEIVMGQSEPSDDKGSAVKSPFAPQIGRGRRQRS